MHSQSSPSILEFCYIWHWCSEIVVENSHSSFSIKVSLLKTNWIQLITTARSASTASPKRKKKLLDPFDSINPHSKMEAPFEIRRAWNGFNLDAIGGGAWSGCMYSCSNAWGFGEHPHGGIQNCATCEAWLFGWKEQQCIRNV